jgi:hypothetical protein
MSDVLGVAHDAPTNASTFRWAAPGVRKLHRKNKVSSKVFRVPSEAVAPEHDGPRHEFRIVMLRGVVRSDAEDTDPIGIFIEFVPSVDATAPPPQGTRVTCACICETDGALTVRREESIIFDGANRTVGFRDILTAAMLADPRYVTDDGVAQVEVMLQIGVNTVVDDLKRTGDRVKASLWSGAASTFSMFSKGVANITAAVGSATHTTDVAAREEEKAPASTPWDSTPPKWRQRAAKWHEYVAAYLPQADATFLTGPERGFTSEEQLLLTQCGLSANAFLTANSAFDYDTDVHQGLLDGEDGAALRAMRYELVPRLLDDVTFWRNYFWRVACLSNCATHEQSATLVAILNAPKSPIGGSVAASPVVASHATPSLTDAEVRSAIAAAQSSAALCTELLEDGITLVSGDATLAAAHHAMRAALVSVRQLLGRSGEACDFAEELSATETLLVDVEQRVASSASLPEMAAAAVAVEETEQAVVPEEVAQPAPTVSQSPERDDTAEVAAADADVSPVPAPPATTFDDDIGDIDDMETPKVDPSANPTASSSTARFSLMPWEEEDE